MVIEMNYESLLYLIVIALVALFGYGCKLGDEANQKDLHTNRDDV